MKNICVLLCFLFSTSAFGQGVFTENFDDGSILSNPTWLGDVSSFSASTGVLTNTDTDITSTPFGIAVSVPMVDTTTWVLRAALNFPPSSGNYARIWLSADNEDLSNAAGYYLKLGESGSADAIRLIRKNLDGAEETIASSLDSSIATAFNVGIKVIRSTANTWTMDVDFAGGTSYSNVFTDVVETGTALPPYGFFGLLVEYTSSNVTDIEFDDIIISPLDQNPPQIISLKINSDTEAEVQYNKSVEQTSAETVGNYTWDNGILTQTATRNASDLSKVTLSVAPSFQSGNWYTLSADNVADLNGNAIDPTMPEVDSFFYVVPDLPAPFDILINELMISKGAPQTVPGSLPQEQYIELYNRTTDKFFQLADYIVVDSNGNTGTLASFLLGPKDYVTICAETKETEFIDSGILKLVTVNSLPILNVSGDSVIFKTDLGEIIHQVGYTSAWDCDTCSYERKNPNLICQEEGNWFPSTDSTGGTPSRENSNFDDAPDTERPLALSATAIDAQIVTIVFNEALNQASAETSTNYTLLGNSTMPTTTLLQAETVQLDFGSTVFLDGQTYQIEVKNVLDCSGANALLADTLSFTFYVPLAAEYNDLIVTEIMVKPDANSALPVNYVEIYNRATYAVDLSNYTLKDNTASSNGKLIGGLIPPNSYVTLCHKDDVALFPTNVTVIGVNSFPGFNGSSSDSVILIDENGDVVHEVVYQPTWDCDFAVDGRYCSMELKKINFFCDGEGNWGPTLSPLLGTPSAENSNFDDTPDNTPPSISAAIQADGQSVFIQFNEVLDVASATDPSNYEILTGIFPDSVAMASPQSVILYFDDPVFVDGVTYDIEISNVKDCAVGNTSVLLDSFTFLITEEPDIYDVLINEIMTDTTPDPLNLPNMEYVELYNRSNKVINLKGMVFDDAELPFYVLEPDNYVVLHHEDYSFNDPSIPVISLPDFKGISNGADLLKLYSADFRLIDAVAFTDDCYAIDGRDEGGWSLERTNVNHPCDQCANWRASGGDLQGGTPGEVNVDAEFELDEIPADLVKAYPISSTLIRLNFTESLDSTRASNPAFFEIDNNLTIVSASPTSPFFNEVLITLNAPLESGIVYTITALGNVYDCVGNPMGMMNTAQVALPDVLEAKDIIINEVLYNPVTGGKDFVEIYNFSNKVVDLNQLRLAKRNEDGIVVDAEQIEQECLLFPSEYVAITEDPAQVLGQYETPNPSGVIYSGLPSYSDDEGDVVLITDGLILDEFHYDNGYEFPLLDDENGVSLERIDFEAETQNPSNWHSAAESVGFATPAYKNSQSGDLVATGNEIFIETNVLSPDEDGHQDYLIVNYNLDQPGFVANVTVYDAKGRLVKTLVQNELLSPEGYFKWDGDTDYGEKARLGIYVVFTELFSADGRKSRFKHSVVVAGRL